jgi:hypothetical protein
MTNLLTFSKDVLSPSAKKKMQKPEFSLGYNIKCKMEVVHSTETSVGFYQTTQHTGIFSHHHDTAKSRTVR